MSKTLTVLCAVGFFMAAVLGHMATFQYDGNVTENEIFENPSGTNPREPDSGGMYFEALRAYRAFLLNRSSFSVTDNDYYATSGGIPMRITDFMSFGEPDFFTLLDMNDDGIPELHVNCGAYEIFGYENGEIVWLAEYGADTVLLDNRALYTRDWLNEDAYEYRDIYFKEYESGERTDILPFSPRGYYRSKCWFSYYRDDHGDDLGELNYKWGNEKSANVRENVSVEEYERVTEPYTEFAKNNRDMIPWANYAEWSRDHEGEYVFPE